MAWATRQVVLGVPEAGEQKKRNWRTLGPTSRESREAVLGGEVRAGQEAELGHLHVDGS